MKKITMFLFFCVSMQSSLNADRWQVLLYMDSSDELSDMAIKNITDLVQCGGDDIVDFFIQLHAYDEIGLRYKITSEGLLYIGQVDLSSDAKHNLLHASEWAFAGHDADHTMLIFWNHGWGILDPVWNQDTQSWESTAPANDACILKRSHKAECIVQHKEKHKGFMFSANPRYYLHNNEMSEALAHIKEYYLQGKDIDIVAFDTCMGGMIEVAYQIAPYARYLVGSQVCSLRDGFDYYHILSALKKGVHPRAMTQEMVAIFDEYYEVYDEDGIYAHTALDLKNIELVKEALDGVIAALLVDEGSMQCALHAHKSTPRFCIYPMYTDLIAYIQEIEAQLPYDQHSQNVRDAIERLYAAMPYFVVARCAGFANNNKTHGCAVYVPQCKVDTTYNMTRFARDSFWSNLLHAVASRR